MLKCKAGAVRLTATARAHSRSRAQSVVEDQIYPSLQTGFNDDNAYIRELTLKASLALAPKMRQGTLTGARAAAVPAIQRQPARRRRPAVCFPPAPRSSLHPPERSYPPLPAPAPAPAPQATCCAT